MELPKWTEGIKDLIVAVCVIALTWQGIIFMDKTQQDIHRVQISTEKTANQVRLFVLDFKRKTIMDEKFNMEIKGEVLRIAKNMDTATGEMALALNEVRKTTENLNKFVVRLDDNINGKLLPQLTFMVETTTAQVQMTLTKITDNMAELTASSKDMVKATEQILLHFDEVIAQNQDLFNVILRDFDTILVNTASITGHVDEIACTIEYYIKDTLKPKNIIIRLGSGIIGAMLPRLFN